MVDRLKGIISLYDFTKEQKLPFYIFADEENDFTPFIQIKSRNIHLNEIERSLWKNKIHFYIDNTIVQNYNSSFLTNKIHHVYTNLDLIKYKFGTDANGRWHQLFHELFKPTELIKTQVDEIIAGRDFIVCSFRFRSRMGDFIDDGREWDDETKNSEVHKLNKAVEEVLSKVPDQMVYIASDSETYLKQLIKINPQRFFYNPNHKVDMNDMERSIIEFLVISKGEKVFQFKRPSMFRGAFSRYASIIGNNKYQLINI